MTDDLKNTLSEEHSVWINEFSKFPEPGAIIENLRDDYPELYELPTREAAYEFLSNLNRDLA